MGKILMDYKAGEWLVDNFDKLPVEFEECEKCGAVYLKHLGHDCSDVLEVEAHPMSIEKGEGECTNVFTAEIER